MRQNTQSLLINLYQLIFYVFYLSPGKHDATFKYPVISGCSLLMQWATSVGLEKNVRKNRLTERQKIENSETNYRGPSIDRWVEWAKNF